MGIPDEQEVHGLLGDLLMIAEERGLALGCGPDGLTVRPMTDEAAEAMVGVTCPPTLGRVLCHRGPLPGG